MKDSTDENETSHVLSDVHTQLQFRTICLNGSHLAETRFIYRIPVALTGEKDDKASEVEVKSSALSAVHKVLQSDAKGDNERADASVCNEIDEDGDLVVNRCCHQNSSDKSVITIIHEMATSLNLVGQQVWPGSLLLCDFALHYCWLFDNAVVLDLGAGVGITSIVAAMVAKTVFCTDRGDEVLDLASENMKLNSHLLRDCDVRVRELDWDTEMHSDLKLKEPSNSREENVYCLSPDDREMMKTCHVILAAEVIYDLDITDAFFRVLYNMLVEKPPKTVLMAVERRQVFTVADRQVVSPAYEHFRENLQDLCSVDEGLVRFMCSQVDVTFPQYFQYQRTKEMELWKIETVFPHR